MQIYLLTEKDIKAIMNLIRVVINGMVAESIDQWDEIYPSEEIIRQDVDLKHSYGIYKNDTLIGYVVINDLFSPEYNSVNWKYSSKALVIHRLAIDPAFQGRGIAKQLMKYAEDFGMGNGYDTIRLDAFIKNPRAIALYEKLGYEKAGEVNFRKGLFYCFEKSLY